MPTEFSSDNDIDETAIRCFLVMLPQQHDLGLGKVVGLDVRLDHVLPSNLFAADTFR